MPDVDDRTWMLLLKRLDAIDKRLDTHGSKLDEIVTQTKRTNGRVDGLEEREKRSNDAAWHRRHISSRLTVPLVSGLAFVLALIELITKAH